LGAFVGDRSAYKCYQTGLSQPQRFAPHGPPKLSKNAKIGIFLLLTFEFSGGQTPKPISMPTPLMHPGASPLSGKILKPDILRADLQIRAPPFWYPRFLGNFSKIRQNSGGRPRVGGSKPHAGNSRGLRLRHKPAACGDRLWRCGVPKFCLPP